MLVRLRRAAMLAPTDWAALAMAAAALLRARLRFARVPAQRLVEQLKAGGGVPLQEPLDPVGAGRVAHLSWAIRSAAAHVPWRSDCLIQVIAANQLLRRYGYHPSFYLGVAKEPDRELAAHAWLRCGDTIVTGGSVERFSVLIGPEREPFDRQAIAGGKRPEMPDHASSSPGSDRS